MVCFCGEEGAFFPWEADSSMNTSPLLVPLSVSFYEEFLSYRSLFKELLKFISVSFASQYVMGESSTNLSYWLRSAFAVNLVAVYLPTSLV